MVKVKPDSSFVQTQIPNATYQVQGLLVPEKKIFKGVSLYGHGSHLGHVTINICYKFTPLNLRSRHIKFEFNWPSGF